MRMLSVTSKLLLTLAVIILCGGADAAPVDCPTISVACSEDGPTIQFAATVSPESPELKLTYQWTVTRGEIKSGQGTRKITLVAERNGRAIGATVEVLELSTNCANKASCTLTHF
jgi:hypothetical protein